MAIVLFALLEATNRADVEKIARRAVDDQLEKISIAAAIEWKVAEVFVPFPSLLSATNEVQLAMQRGQSRRLITVQVIGRCLDRCMAASRNFQFIGMDHSPMVPCSDEAGVRPRWLSSKLRVATLAMVAINGDKACLASDQLKEAICYVVYRSPNGYAAVWHTGSLVQFMAGSLISGRPEWMSETADEERLLDGKYTVLIAARFCASRGMTFDDGDVQQIEEHVRSRTSESPLPKSELDRIWTKNKSEFDGLRSLGLGSDYEKLRQYCERMAFVKQMAIPTVAEENPFAR
ncbi:hypothetical protein [Flaviflagellibacter deserti]|uniref:Uncharacterized protein n=1 Tax=Flaviflagellibacter deserti TaxID=2267266 RepID=A0ABV9YYH7_9HYPH